MLTSLPLEVLHRIGNETARLEDRKSLRRTCSLLAMALKPHVLAELTLNMHGHNLEPGISFLRALMHEKVFNLDSEDPRAISKYVRTLHVDSLSPSFFPDAEFEKKQENFKYTYEVEDRVRSWAKFWPPPPSDSRVYVAERTMYSLLGPALKSLHNLETVRLRWHWKDYEEVLSAMMAFLSSPDMAPNIKEFTFEYTPSEEKQDGPVPLPYLPNLQVLSVSGKFSDDAFENLMKYPTISASSLRAFEVSRQGHCFGYVPMEDPISSTITSLKLSWSSIRVKQVVHANLTSLNLDNVKLMDEGGKGLVSWSELWNALSLEHVRLRSLVLSGHPGAYDDFVDYLQSYSGLEVLGLIGTGPRWYVPSKYNIAADRFFEEALPMHVDSLVKLEVMPAFESRWCFGAHNAEAFRKCRRLRTLGLKVAHRGLERDPLYMELLQKSQSRYIDVNLPSESTDHPNSVHFLLSMISSSLPDLEKLTLDAARKPEWAPHHMDAMFGVRYRLEYRRRIHASIASFTCLNSDDDVLKWVKVYIGNERVIVNRYDVAEDTIEAEDTKEIIFEEEDFHSEKDVGTTDNRDLPLLTRISGVMNRILA
ncbi:hypothetical protein GYMLUDRAFT_38605 [Collybiopsis luxurians FD-317 M1]|nr:hypothetical protein GYMLUDRAFT_38605 [Collybiopsis luxurians FD-317 M1]